jgi:hypothetical protein
MHFPVTDDEFLARVRCFHIGFCVVHVFSIAEVYSPRRAARLHLAR